MRRILVIAAHPDDELLGCGGTVARHTASGDEVRILIMCEGESLRYFDMNTHQRDDSDKAALILGVSKVYRLDFPDQKLDQYTLIDIIKPIEEIVSDYQPQTVYVQYGNDLNRDHRIVFEAASVALRPTMDSIDEIYAFYTVGSTELQYPSTFQPDTYVNIADYIDKKIQAFSCYETEVKVYPHPRSIQGLINLACFTGNQVCMDKAEAFVTIRRITR